ncbi:uncharacterized protein LDX57_005298 [Aspergillus melleus]|uniref:uncharacterized protein n=1 Tax=Aspergillus melleus TaxID=138277 RepID=UPI001E8D9258|nr:uncharacterized protein LDX57_005298 [Aspergillus melleus]KAH8427584.1 hypothetical protein LDX57_005298 [Aspergillus melleus]
MALPVTEFIYFQLKSSVKPEDPANEEGQALLNLFTNTKHQSGYQNSAWGRTKEDESIVVWVIDWKDAHDGIQPALLTPFLAPSTQPTIIFSTLNPPTSKTHTLTKNPVTELCALAFPNTMTPDEHKALTDDLINFRTTLTESLPEGSRPTSWAMGYVERPGTLQHEKSADGQAFVHLLAVGWESVERHMEVKGTEEFGGAIKPIREKMLSPVPGLGMKHVSFKGV